ncbi:hypothetical protein ACQKP0_04065 [Heyndrickxia sp. NPDC080065]|uniref:hypothetical protein n=1 Tax=Heyndrickxia sp. NPDC080065 TaxID=3390568 RepID=UPI003D075F90
MYKNEELEKEKRIIREIQRDISLVTAVLLLTGQITIRGVFVTSKAFRLSLGGPLTGTPRTEGVDGNKIATAFIDVFDIIIAILLIKGLIAIEGTFVGASEFTLLVSGPIFGMQIPEPSLPHLRKDYSLYKKVTRQFHINKELINQLKRNDEYVFNRSTND